jgi:hypothetical protein
LKKNHIFTLLAGFLICAFQLQLKAGVTPAKEITASRTIQPFPAAINSPTLLPQDTCLNKKFSVVFYVILDYANSLPGTPPANVATYLATYPFSTVINQLNTAFARLCVTFENCKTVAIPNYTYNTWQAGIIDSVIVDNWYTPNTLNIYIPTNLTSGYPIDAHAYASPLPTGTVAPKDFIVIQKNNILVANGVSFIDSDLLHAVGHFFGLVHTSDEISGLPPFGNGIISHELVDGSNSATNGDGLEDTEADCYPIHHNINIQPVPLCNYDYTPGVRDVNGNYYTPPVDNIMSGYNCRCRFTQQQYNKMAKTILTKRLYLH